MQLSTMRTTNIECPLPRMLVFWLVVTTIVFFVGHANAQDQRDGAPVRQSQSTATTRVQSATWTSATADETRISISVRGHGAISFSFDPTGSITGGSITFECNTTASGTYFSVLATRSDSFTAESSFALSGATKKLWQRSTAGFTECAIRLDAVITDTGTANVKLQAIAASSTPAVVAGLAAGTNNVGDIDVLSFPDNEPFNVAQINGVTPLMGAGNTGTGSPRVTQATDQAALAAWGHGATGAAPPAGATQTVGRVSGATGGLTASPIFCDNFDSGSISVNTQIVTGVASRRVYFCSFWVQMNGGANTVAVVEGTGTTCATTTARVPGIGPATTAANSMSFAANSGIVVGGGANEGPVAKTSVDADNVCILVGSATLVVWGASWAIL